MASILGCIEQQKWITDFDWPVPFSSLYLDAGLIDSDALFNEATQDAVAELLMERRGLSRFVGGELSAEDFANNLAREWASFPVVHDQQGASRHVKKGQSYYAGDGLNKAYAEPDEFLSIVKGILAASAELPETAATTSLNAPEQATAQPEIPVNLSILRP